MEYTEDEDEAEYKFMKPVAQLWKLLKIIICVKLFMENLIPSVCNKNERRFYQNILDNTALVTVSALWICGAFLTLFLQNMLCST